jgi:hypothetical protein
MLVHALHESVLGLLFTLRRYWEIMPQRRVELSLRGEEVVEDGVGDP